MNNNRINEQFLRLSLFIGCIVSIFSFKTSTQKINFLRYKKGGIKFSSIILLSDGTQQYSAKNGLASSLYQGIVDNADNVFMVSIAFQNANHTLYVRTIEKILKAPINTLIIVQDFQTCHLIQKTLHELSADYFHNNTWVFINPNKISSALHSNISKELAQYFMKYRIRLDSLIYLLHGNHTHATLLEVYKICKNTQVTIKEVQLIEYGDDIIIENDRRWDRRNDLMGCNLRIAYVDSYHYITMANSSKDVKYIDSRHILISGNTTMFAGAINELELTKQLAMDLNFTITWIKAKDNSYGVFNQHSKAWDGLIGLIVRGEAELSNAYLTVTSSRREVISFTSEFHQSKFGIYMAKPSISQSWTTYLDVFSFLYWCVLFALLAFFAFILALFFFDKNDLDHSHIATSFFKEILSSASVMLLTLANEDLCIGRIKHLYRSYSFKVLIFVIGMLGWFVKESYTGGLISSLIDQRYESQINHLEDILFHQDYQLILKNGTASVQYFENAKEWPYKQLWDTQLKNNDKAYINNEADAEKLLLNYKKCVYFDRLSEVEPIFESYPCSIIRSRKTYFHHPIALAFKKNSPYLGLFNHQLRLYKESGILANMVSLKKNQKGMTNCRSDPLLYIGYETVCSAFAALTIGMAMAITYLIIELLYEKYYDKSNPALQVDPRILRSICTGEDYIKSDDMKEKAMDFWTSFVLDVSGLKEIPPDILRDIQTSNNEILDKINRKLCPCIILEKHNTAVKEQ